MLGLGQCSARELSATRGSESNGKGQARAHERLHFAWALSAAERVIFVLRDRSAPLGVDAKRRPETF